MSPDGTQLVFSTDQYEENTVSSTAAHVWDLVSGTEATRFGIPVGGSVADVSATWVMTTLRGDDGLQALAFALSDPEADPIRLPIAGTARFVDTAIDIAAPVQVGA